MVTSFSKEGSALSQHNIDFPQGQERMVVEASGRGCFLFTLAVQILVNKQKGANATWKSLITKRIPWIF